MGVELSGRRLEGFSVVAAGLAPIPPLADAACQYWLGISPLLRDIVLKKHHQVKCSSFPCQGLGARHVRSVKGCLPETRSLSRMTPMLQMARAVSAQREQPDEIVTLLPFSF